MEDSLTERIGYLRKIDLFAGFSEEKCARIADLCVWKNVTSKTMIFSQSDAPGGVYFLASGTVRASIYSATGKNVVFQDMQAGRMFGEISALDGSERSASIETKTPCLIAMLSPEAFIELLREEPEISLHVIRMLTGEIRRLSSRVVEFSTLSVPGRVHAELLRLAPAQTSGETVSIIKPAPKLSDIANRISTHREAVSRELSRLIKSGLIIRTSGSLQITDLARLEQMVENADRE